MKTMRDIDTPTTLTRPPAPKRRSSRSLILVCLLVGALAFVVLAVATTPDVDDTAPAPPVTTQLAPATAVAPAPVDFGAEVRRLEAADHYLRLHPDPGQVGAVYDPENPVYAEALAFQRQLVSGERRYDPLPEPWPVDGTRLIERHGDVARVHVMFAGSPRYRILDREGRVVSDRPAGGPRSAVWTLRLRDGQWRILTSEAV